MTSHRAFTLVEMLLVVAILSLLVGILLPVLGKSRHAARHSVCMSNLAQLSHAVDHRALDHQQRYFEYRATPAAPLTGIQWWFGLEPVNSLTTQRPIDHANGPLGPYLAGIAERLQCDEFPYENASHVAKFARRAASYGYNWKLSGMKKIGATGEIPDETVRPQTKSRYRGNMSDVFLFADSVFFEPHANPLAFFEGYYIAYQSNTTSLSGYAHFRHSELANVAYLDGHVAPQSLTGGFHKIVSGGKAGNLAAADGSAAIYGN